MTSDTDLTLEERIRLLMRHLGIERAHFAASLVADYRSILHAVPQAVASLTLVSPQSFDVEVLRPVQSRLLVITGDQGPISQRAFGSLPQLPEAVHGALEDYSNLGWSDIAADRTQQVGTAIREFLDDKDQKGMDSAIRLPEGEGEHDGITYQIRGSGPPLVLFPLGLAPSQWEPLIPELSEFFSTVILGGAHLGSASDLEMRARSGYRALVRNLIDELDVADGDSVLDLGCGSGVHSRYLAAKTEGRNQITGIDFSPYMVREARGIARSEGLIDIIDFQEGNAEMLSLPDNSFDVVMSVTMMEEVDADLMMQEMVRVTRPGGRIGIIVRAVDLQWVVNLPVSSQIKEKVEKPGALGGGVSEKGCADAGLYYNFLNAGLRDVKMFPQWGTFGNVPQRWNFESQAASRLTVKEAEEWRDAAKKADAHGTFFIAMPFHCAVGTKPS